MRPGVISGNSAAVGCGLLVPEGLGLSPGSLLYCHDNCDLECLLNAGPWFSPSVMRTELLLIWLL